MSPRAEHWVGTVKLTGRVRQKLGQRSNLADRIKVRRVLGGSRWSLQWAKMQHFSCVAEAGLWFMFAVTKISLFVLTAEGFLLNSGNVISLVVLVRFVVSVGICKKTFHKASSSFGIMGFDLPSGALDVHNICWLYVWSSSLDLLWAQIKEEEPDAPLE